MNTDVFFYEWTYTDFQLDQEITRRSDFKVTREFVEARKRDNLMHARYQLIEESKESVALSAIADGKYDPKRIH